MYMYMLVKQHIELPPVGLKTHTCTMEAECRVVESHLGQLVFLWKNTSSGKLHCTSCFALFSRLKKLHIQGFMQDFEFGRETPMLRVCPH